MKRKNTRIIGMLSLFLALALMLAACADPAISSVKLTAEQIETQSGDYYYAGIVKQKSAYYLKALTEIPQDEAAEGDYRYIPLADELNAAFQEDGWVGAWSPVQYLTAKELAQAELDQKITLYARFSCEIENGKATELMEYDYYQGTDVTTGKVDAAYIDRWFMYGDMTMEFIEIKEDYSWAMCGRLSLSGDPGGGHPYCCGEFSVSQDGTLKLYETEGAEVGTVMLEQDVLTIAFQPDFVWAAFENDPNELYYLHERESVYPENLGEYTPPPTLLSGWRFTGLEPLEANNDYRGGYFYQDRTEDGLTLITNCCFSTDQGEDEDLDPYVMRCVAELTGRDIEPVTMEQNEEYSTRFAYPVYLLSWQAGGNEDARGCDAFFFMTDTHSYFYIFDTTVDNQIEMRDTWYEVFGQLELQA